MAVKGEGRGRVRWGSTGRKGERKGKLCMFCLVRSWLEWISASFEGWKVTVAHRGLYEVQPEHSYEKNSGQRTGWHSLVLWDPNTIFQEHILKNFLLQSMPESESLRGFRNKHFSKNYQLVLCVIICVAMGDTLLLRARGGQTTTL